MEEPKKMSDFLTFQSSFVNDEVVEEYERKQVEEKRLKKTRMLEEHYRNGSGVNKKFINLSLSDYCCKSEEQQKALNVCKEFVINPQNKLLLIHGDYGTGKTMLGSTMIREIGGQYITAYRLCVEYESASDFKAVRNKLQVLDFYSQCDFLVIDEVGATDKVLMEKELLPNIINERYENNLPSCIITNLAKQEIVKLLGMRTYDRLLEICISIQLMGESFRKQQRVC